MVLLLTFGQGGLKNLDLLVQEGKFVVSSDELGAEDVSFVDDLCVLFLLLFVLAVGFLDNVGQLEKFLLGSLYVAVKQCVLVYFGLVLRSQVVTLLLRDRQLVLGGR